MGPVSAIIPARRGDELRALARQAGAGCVRERQVVPRLGEEPGHLLLELRRGAVGSVEQMPPLVVHVGAGRAYCDEIRDLLRES